MTARDRVGVVALAALASTVVLHVAGSGLLATPPLGSWAGLEAWFAQRGPAAVIALVRLVGFAAGCWLTSTAVLQLVAPLVARDRFTRLVDATSPRFLRALSAAGLTMGLTLRVVPVGAMENPPGIAVLVPLDVPGTTSSTTTTPSTTMPPTTTTAVSAAPPARPAPIAEAPVPTVRGGEVVVGPGDSFWSIAAGEVGGRELIGYWRALIDLNRDRLVDPSNPDLLYPDQVLRLP